MARALEQYDAALLGILQNEGNIADFLDVIHGFLFRKTDFFHIMTSEKGTVGFPPGAASKIVMNSFRKFENLAQTRRKEMQEKKTKEQIGGPASQNSEPTRPKKPALDPQGGAGDQTGAAASDKSAAAAEPSCGEVRRKDSTPSGLPGHSDHDPSTQPPPGEQLPAPKSSEDPASNGAKETSAGDKGEDKGSQGDGKEEEDPALAAERRRLQANPETYNGADRGTYRWSQTILEVDVYVGVPESVRKGSMVRVTSDKKHLKVAVLGADRQWQELVDGELTWEVKQDPVWSLEPGRHVQISLEKREERWWEALLVGEPKINTRKIDCSRPMTDLDDEAQAKIDELMYNQHQKRLGKPQSHEQKTHKLLKDAWNAPGSPFAGTPFDPSRVSVDPSGVVQMK